MRYILISLLSLFSLQSIAQGKIKGIVIDAENNEPIVAASVFLNTTSIGTVTSSDGSFELYVPAGKFELIISSIGYETYYHTITSSDILDTRIIKLYTKPKELETVVIEPFETKGWEKWGRFFTDHFIGLGSSAKNCKIINYKSIRFRNSKKTNELTAYALEPLIIENTHLGYTIQYQLELFSYNFKTKMLFYQGFAFFSPMKVNARRQNIWNDRRQEAYYGSIMHFMRSLYRNRIVEEGFEMRALKKIPNAEKQRVQVLMYDLNKQQIAGGNVTVTMGSNTGGGDSSSYYNRILSQPDAYDVLNTNILNGDSVAFAIDSVTAGLAFDDYLQISYTNKQAPEDYLKNFPDNGSSIISQIILINNMPIAVQANGLFFNPQDLLSSGYWSWSEKISNMLPFDYWPPKNQTKILEKH